MRKKIGTIVDEDLIFMAKEVALAQKRPLNLIIEEALRPYIKDIEEPVRRKRIAESTKGIMKTPKESLKKIMEEEGVSCLDCQPCRFPYPGRLMVCPAASSSLDLSERKPCSSARPPNWKRPDPGSTSGLC